MNAPYFQTESLIEGRFIERPNRFIVHYALNGAGRRRGQVDGEEEGRAYMANPGKLQEILVPGTTLLLAGRPHTKVGIEVVGAKWERRWAGDVPRAVFLNTGQINRLAETLLRQKLIPELAAYEVARAEVKVGDSRFDFLLVDGEEERLVEVKSVTLVEHGVAMFPDARTDRGRRHVEELMELARAGRKTSVLFIVQGEAERFLPDLHNDLEFARTLWEAAEHVELLAYVVSPRLDEACRLCFEEVPLRLEIPWERLASGLDDSGLYLAVLTVAKKAELEIGRRGVEAFEAGHYIYIGSARRHLTRRIERHKRKRKGMHYHIDFLRQAASQVQTFPIRGGVGECDLAADIAGLGERVAGFGASDCRCPGHLVYCAEDPVRTGAFQRVLTAWRHGI